MDFDYTIITTKDFDSVVEDVQQEIVKAGLKVLYVHDVQKTLAEKGFERGPLKIVEFCSAKYAYEFLKVDVKIGLCMPCKINVYIENDEMNISGMRPIILPEFFPNSDLGEKPQEIDQIIKDIIDKAK